MAAKKKVTRKSTTKRELIDTGTYKLFVRRNEQRQRDNGDRRGS